MKVLDQFKISGKKKKGKNKRKFDFGFKILMPQGFLIDITLTS